MTEFGDLLPAAGWQRLAADFLWQSTLVGLVGMILVRAFRKRPALRAAVALLAAGLCIAAPVTSALVRGAGWGQLAAASRWSEPASMKSSVTLPRSLPVTTPSVAAPDIAVNTIDDALSAGWGWRMVAAGWLLLSTYFMLRLARSMLAVWRIKRRATACRVPAICAELMRAAKAQGMLPPELCTCAEIHSPALLVWGRPRIVLPARSLERIDWYAVFCHELAHLARHDGVSRMAMEMAMVVLPWQPLVWLLRSEFRAACEEACDDWSVAAGADPVELAAVLTEFIPQSQPALVLAMSESVAATRSRVLRLLAMEGVPRPGLGRLLGVTGWLLAGTLAVILAILQRGGPTAGGGNDLPPWGDQPTAVAAARMVHAKEQPPRQPYRVQPPDVLMIDAIKLVPKAPYRVQPLDQINVTVLGTLPDQPIQGPHSVETDGTITLGPTYGAVNVSGKTLAEVRDVIHRHLEEILTAPEISVTLHESAGQQQIAGEHLIGPDGQVNLGIYGSVAVAGMTLAQVRAAIEKHLAAFLEKPEISVDVFAYNSLVFYVVTDGGDLGDTISRLPCTGNDTVLDAFAQAQLNRKVSLGSCWVWISRPSTVEGANPQILPVDWQAIVERGETATNWQIQPGDRLFIRSRRNAKGTSGESY